MGKQKLSQICLSRIKKYITIFMYEDSPRRQKKPVRQDKTALQDYHKWKTKLMHEYCGETAALRCQ